MRLTDASVAIRPRNPWEAIDLGVLMVQEHRSLLMISWAMVTLPVFALLTAVLWDYPSLAIFLFWWLKPLYERLTLLILSQTLFGITPTLKQALLAWPRALKPQLLASLTWRRLSLSRSFKLPVQQLEGLSGTEQAHRIATLSRDGLSAARCLTSVGSALEMCLWVGLMGLFYSLLPQQVEIDWSWQSLLEVEGQWTWLEHLTNAFYALVLMVWGPLYVACGFSLYLNRRTQLEAWDIELIFRRMRQRLTGSAYAILLGCALLLSIPATPVMADESLLPPRDAQTYSCPLPPLDQPDAEDSVAAPASPRLLEQALTSKASETAIKGVLENPPFKNPKTVSGWRIDQKPDVKQARSSAAPSWVADMMRSLLAVASLLANAVEVLLWTAIAVSVGWCAWRYRSWIGTFVSGSERKTAPRPTTPQQLFGLQVNTQSLPGDVATSVEALWTQQPREALSLLYRALLNRLLTDYQLPLKNADTEGQVLQRIATLNQPSLQDFSRILTSHWQNLAYGHSLPPLDAQQALCDEWRRLFPTGKSV
ncbi:DUF4129 domain-containing protein [Pseudomonas huanghezhanensis]|uniref:DUF4129 domain-containing protein n=1 Tax=Pseudomonas huanghezhanensis TaxID=3002903 RepID=UPI0022864142|nr:DUF4129 domain-containing protein [Pseudomonas sp. BSw22131]